MALQTHWTFPVARRLSLECRPCNISGSVWRLTRRPRRHCRSSCPCHCSARRTCAAAARPSELANNHYNHYNNIVERSVVRSADDIASQSWENWKARALRAQTSQQSHYRVAETCSDDIQQINTEIGREQGNAYADGGQLSLTSSLPHHQQLVKTTLLNREWETGDMERIDCHFVIWREICYIWTLPVLKNVYLKNQNTNIKKI